MNILLCTQLRLSKPTTKITLVGPIFNFVIYKYKYTVKSAIKLLAFAKKHFCYPALLHKSPLVNT